MKNRTMRCTSIMVFALFSSLFWLDCVRFNVYHAQHPFGEPVNEVSVVALGVLALVFGAVAVVRSLRD